MGGWSSYGSFSFFSLIAWLETIVIGALLIAWLWKQIRK